MHFLRHLVNFPQFCIGPQILRRMADSAQNSACAESQNTDIPTHIMPVLVLLSVVGVGMQQYMIQNHILNSCGALLNATPALTGAHQVFLDHKKRRIRGLSHVI